jgi:Ca-activated chloride channel homolog
MISFAQPLWPFIGIVEFLFRRMKQPAIRYSNTAIMKGLSLGRAAWLTKCQSFLRVFSLACLIIAAAGPRIPDSKTRLTAEGISIVFALDVSGSMAEKDFGIGTNRVTSRIDAAKQAFRFFVEGGTTETGEKFDGRLNDQIGIVSFAAWPEPICPLTFQRSVLMESLQKIQTKSGVDAGTNIGDAIAESLVRLNGSNDSNSRRKVIILLSDGEHNISIVRDDPPLKPRQAAQLAADIKVPIYAIDCGGSEEKDEESIKRRTEGVQILNSIATMTGGRYFAANDTEQLQAVYAEIDRLEKQTAERFIYRKYFELSWHFALAGLALLACMLILERVTHRVLPESF